MNEEQAGFAFIPTPKKIMDGGVADARPARLTGRVYGINKPLRRMIHDGAGEHELEAYARQKSPGIRHEGLRKVSQGVTTLEEVLRVTRAD